MEGKFRINYVASITVDWPMPHRHITDVGWLNPDGTQTPSTAVEIVIKMISNGDTFVVIDPAVGEVSLVPIECGLCHTVMLPLFPPEVFPPLP